MSLNAVVFDMDGTLLDSSATVPAAYAAAIYDLSGRRCSDEEVIAAYSAGHTAALIGTFIGRSATDADVECWLGHLGSRLALTIIYPGVLDMITELRKQGLAIGVFTGATRRAAELQLRHANLAELVDALVGSDEIGAVKPAPDGIHLVCDRLGVHPRDVAYVGDAQNDLRCARAAGALPVAAAWGHLYEPDDDFHVIVPTPHEMHLVLAARELGPPLSTTPKATDPDC